MFKMARRALAFWRGDWDAAPLVNLCQWLSQLRLCSDHSRSVWYLAFTLAHSRQAATLRKTTEVGIKGHDPRN